MSKLVDFENQAGIARITCGWKKPHLPLDFVRRYWRDVHSPAISRRAGIYEYRHSQYDDVRTDVFPLVAGVNYSCNPAQQLMWLSDVRYRDQAGLDVFGTSPDAEVKGHLLGDIDLLVDQSSTYKAVDANARTLVDTTGNPTPQGLAAPASFSVFFRQRDSEAALHTCVAGLATRWAAAPGVLRVRVHLFEAPDMEAEKKAGYPIKTHAKELQYQAWIDLVLADESVAKTLLTAADGVEYAEAIRDIHAYPVVNLFTFVYGGKPTLVGLRGFGAYEAITKFNAANQMQPSLLEWMYGPVAEGGPVKPEVA